ncbi:hypothetical protein MICH65_0001 [Candidatus Chazhemtobacterium aquaticus]|uniref:Peptidase S74 domain-containing protein n=2 Tax=Candidatus Chazhemtobacterium aquaticus TaxID=2715735 RepID=A0A857NAJ6_9BACT|nr:hypothetical protein MICH65_0001 [Candidatus Chazhemtobacterium aquaticus]
MSGNLNTSGNLTVGGTTTLGGLTYTWPGSQANNYVLSTNGSGTLSWVDPASAVASTIYWTQTAGALHPKNSTVDLLVGSNASASAIFRVDTSTGNLISVAGSNWMPRSNSTTALNIANAAGSPFVTFDTTNQRVGIGITTPRTKLHIADTAVGGNIDGLKISNLDTSTNSSARIVFGVSTVSEIYSAGISAIRTNSPAAHATDLTFSTCAGSCTTEGNMAERLRLTSIGNLGLGLTSPTGKLHIYGDYAGNASAIIDSRNSSDILTASASGTPRLTILNNGNLQFHQASIITTTTGALTLAPDSASDIQFYSSSNTLSSSGNLTLAGNINLTSGDLQTGGTSRITNAGNLTNIGTTQFNGLTYTWPGSQTNNYVLSTNGSGTLSWVDPASAVASTIYWTQTAGALHPKNATVDLLVGSNATASAIFRVDATTGNLVSLSGAKWMPRSDSTTALNIANATGSPFVTFDTTNQRLGIGTTSPTATLHLAGNALFQNTVDSTSAFRVNNAAGTTFLNLDTTNTLASIQGANTEAVLSAEKVTNGNFSSNPSGDWTYSSPWNWDGAEMDHTGTTGAIDTVANGGILMNHGGTGYTAGNVLTLTNGANDAQVTVSTVDANGAITAWTLSNAGTACTVNSSVAVTGGTGSGANFNIVKLVDSAATLSQNVSVSSGNNYQVTYTIRNRTAGQVKLTLGGVAGHYVLANGTYTQVIAATGTGNLIFTPTVDFTGSIDDISVKQITASAPTLALNASSGALGLELRTGGANLHNVLLGDEAGRSNTTGANNNFLGSQSGYSNTTGYSNNFLGYQSGYSNTTGYFNNFLGQQSGRSNTTGVHNNFLGYQSGYSNTTGYLNNFLGSQSGYSNTTGYFNDFLGNQAGYYNQTGTGNLAIGYRSFGYGTGAAFTGADYNTIIGYEAGYSLRANSDNNVFIGYRAGYSETGSNKLYLANSSTTSLIYGDFSTGVVGLGGTSAHSNPYVYISNTGNVGIGTTSPTSLLSVGSTSQFQVNSSGHIVAIGNVAHTIDDVSGNLTLTSNSSTISLNDNVTFAGTTTFNNLTYTWPASHEAAGYVLTNNGSGTLTWVDVAAATGGTIYWHQAGGVVYPKNDTVDLLVGGSATSSAKFAFINVNSGTPTASISGTTANVATYLTGEGNLATTNMAPLTIGGSTTGSISLANNTAITGNLTTSGNADIDGTLTSGTGNAFQVDTTGNLSSTGTTGITLSGAGADLTFSGTGDHDITASAGTLRLGAATLTGSITGNSQSITGLSQLTVDNLRLDGNTIDTTSGNLTLDSTTGQVDVNDNLNITGSLTVGTTTEFNNITYTWPASQSTNYVLSTNGSGTLSWVDPAGAASGAIYWAQSGGALYPKNATVDLLVGSSASASAIFRVDTSTGNLISVAGSKWMPRSDSTTALNIANAAGTSFVTFDTTNQRVGIGTSSPSAPLHVDSGTWESIFSDGTIDLKHSNGNTYGKIGNMGGTYGLQSYVSYPLVFRTNNLERVRIDWTNGNVGIGTTSPSEKLDVAGNATVSGNLTFTGSASTIANRLMQPLTIGDSQTGNLRFFSSSNTLSSTGNLTLAGNINLTSGDLQTGGTSRITNTGNLTNIGTTQFNGLTYTWPSSHNSSGYILSNNGSGTLSWVDPATAAAGSIYWLQSDGAVYPKNATVDLLVGGNSTASAKFAINSTLGSLTLKDSSLNTLFSVSPSGLVSNVPSSFTSSGNVSLAYDLLLTNQTSSSIKSNAPLTIEAGESFESNHLTLKTYNQGNILLDSVLTQLSGGLSVSSYATISSSLALGNTNASAGPGHLNMTGNLTMGGNLNLTSEALQTNSTTRITNTGNLTNIGTTQFNGLTYTWPATHETSGYVLSNNGSGTLTWVDANSAASGSIYWTQTGAAVHPKNSTVDLLVGGSATSSAKFAVLNINSGTPTASISGTTANVATYLTGQGNLATTNMAPLTIGGSTTGSLTLDENTTITGNLALSGNEADLTFSGTGNHDITASAGTLRFGAATLTGAITGNSQNITGLNNLTGVTSTFSTSITTPLLTNAGNLTLSATGANNILFSTNGTERWRVTSTGILQSNGAQTIQTSNANLTLATGGGNGHIVLTPNGTGNVGVNNASPAYKLDVTGDINFTGALRANGTAGTTGQVLVSQGSSNPVWSDISGAIGGDAWLQGGNSFGATGILGTNDSNDLQFETNNTTRMTIDTSGDVGIGTTNPGAKLETAGAISITTGYGTISSTDIRNPTLGGRGTSPNAGSLAFGDNTGWKYHIGTSVTGTFTPRVTFVDSGNVGIGNTAPTSLLSVGSSSQFQVDSSGRMVRIDGVAHTIDDVSGNLTLTSNSTTISLNDNVTFAGTTTLNGLTYTWPGSQTANYVLSTNGSGTLTWVAADAAAAGSIYWTLTNEQLHPKNASWHDLMIGGTSTASAKFFAQANTGDGYFSGELGLGTTTPTAKLDIQATPSVYTSEVGNIRISNASDTTEKLYLGFDNNLGTYGSGYIQSSKTGTTWLPTLINPNGGYVGINNTSPSRALHVEDDSGIYVGDGTKNIQIFTSGTDNDISSSHTLHLNYNNNQAVSVGEGGTSNLYVSGSVGIGNTSPTSLFSVGSSSQFQVNSSGNIVNLGGAAHSISNASGNLTINSAGTLVLADTNIQLSGGSTTFDVYNNAADTTLTINNSSATYRSHLSLEGQLKLGTYTATPSGIAAGAVYYDTTLDRPYYFNGLGNWVPFSAGEGGGGSKWTITDGSLHPNNSTLDLTIGGSSTSSAAFAFTGISSSTRTATISGNLALSVPTGSAPTTSLNILNGGSFNIKTSVGGDAGLASRLFISNDGKVGIGTTSPLSELHIPNGTIRTDGFVSESDWGSFGFNMYWDNTQSQWEYASNGYASLIQQDGTNGGLYIATATSGTAGNLASWSKALTIDVDGNVGIGTDTPQAKLDIAGASSTITNTSGDITINSASGKISFAGDSLNNFLHATASGQIKPGSYGSNPYPIGDGAIIYRSDLNQLYYYNGTSWQSMGSGSGYWDVFSGLLFPSNYSTYDLAVGGNTTASAKFFVNHSTGAIKIADSAGTDFHTIANDGNNLKITGSSNGSKVILQPDLQINGGDILGSSGSTRISLVDTLSLTSVSGFLAIDRAATISAGLASDLTLHLKGAASQTANYMAITSNGGSTGNIFAVDSSGNVGIGRTSPSAKLDVAGSATISGTLAVGVMNQADAGTCNAAAEGRIFYDKGVRLYKACTYNSDDSSYAWRPLGGLSDQHRRDISTDSVVNNQVIRKGWTYSQGAAVNQQATVSYGITFDDVPIVVAARAGNKTAAPAPTSLSDCTSSTYYIEKGVSMKNISTTGFQIEVGSSTGAYDTSDYVCFTWIAIGSYSSGYGADLAEYYLTHDASLDAAEIVAIDPDNDIAVTKADPTTNPAVIGIVSTQAGAILGNKDGTTPGVETSITGQEVENGSKTVPVALAGRVPVKVSLENGPIYRGDALTLSPTLPGTAVKATTPGPIIGRALENFTGTATIVDSLDPDQVNNEQQLEQEAFNDLNQGIGKIMVFIQNSYYSPVMTASSATSSATIAFDHQGNLINPNDDLTAQAQASTQTDFSFFDRFISLIVKNLTALNITSRSITTQELVSPLVDADQITTNTLTTNLIKPQSDSDLILSLNNQSATTPAQLLITDSQDNTVTSIDSSGNATFSGELVANSAKFDSLEVGNLKANQIEGLTDTLSQIKSASEAAQLFLDRLTAKHSLQDESLNATAQQLISTSSSQLISTLEDNFTLDSDGTHLALTGLSSDYAYFSDYLAVEGTLMTNDLYVENNLITSSISSPLDADDQTLYLQPTGTGAINLLSGLLILDESGTVSLNGNLIVTGTLESGSATISGTLDLRATNLDNSGEATHSGFGRLLSIYNEQGEQVASVNASGSAQFNDLTTRQIIIAASQDSTPSASQLSTNSNTTIGTATIPAGELTTYIENNNISDTTLIYITPISDTKNQVLYVKNKYSCPVDAPLSCQPFFTVAINQPTTQDIQFNYWLIQTQ